jgi:hypothetical protein
MSEYVRIHKGNHELTVSEKAFNSIYKEKGFELADGEELSKKTSPPKKGASKGAKGKGKTAGADSDKSNPEETES